jgi:hypothetical protein
MKRKTASLFLGLCLAIFAVAASPAHARSTTGFSAFHVENQGTLSSNPYTCVGESYGAVVNNCSYAVSLEFDLPVDNSGTHSITVQDYWYGWPNNTDFSCQAYSYAGNGSYEYGGQITFSEPVQSLQFSVNVPNSWSMQVICWNVPPGGGISNINWSV